MICAVLITLPSNGQTLSTWSVFIIPDSVIGSLSPSVVFGYKGVLLIFGIFLAYQTQSVRLKQVNDFRFVGMSIYNVVMRIQKQFLSYLFIYIYIYFFFFLFADYSASPVIFINDYVFCRSSFWLYYIYIHNIAPQNLDFNWLARPNGSIANASNGELVVTTRLDFKFRRS